VRGRKRDWTVQKVQLFKNVSQYGVLIGLALGEFLEIIRYDTLNLQTEE